MIERKAFKYRLRFSKPEEAVPLYRFAGSCRFLWNLALAHQIERMDKGKLILSYPEMAEKLLKGKKRHPFPKEMPSQALQ